MGTTPTLGDVLRGARLGYGWAGELGAFMRISDVGPDSYLVDIRPAAALPKKPGDGGPAEHRVTSGIRSSEDRSSPSMSHHPLTVNTIGRRIRTASKPPATTPREPETEAGKRLLVKYQYAVDYEEARRRGSVGAMSPHTKPPSLTSCASSAVTPAVPRER